MPFLMAPQPEAVCRLCGARVQLEEMHRQLCPICDEYAQHVELQSNKRLDRVVGEVQHASTFRAASQSLH